MSKHKNNNKINSEKNGKVYMKKIPKYVIDSFENYEIFNKYLTEDFNEQIFQNDIGVTYLGILIKCINPNTKKKFSIVITDEELTSNEFYLRYQSSLENNGCLIAIDEGIQNRKKMNNN